MDYLLPLIGFAFSWTLIAYDHFAESMFGQMKSDQPEWLSLIIITTFVASGYLAFQIGWWYVFASLAAGFPLAFLLCMTAKTKAKGLGIFGAVLWLVGASYHFM